MGRNPINWSQLGAQERNALVAEKVFRRRVYREDTWGRWLLLRDDQPGLTEPIPPYSQSMDAAWLVFLFMMEQYWQYRDSIDDRGLVFEVFAKALMGECAWAYDDEIFPGHNIFTEIAGWTPESICIAALRACGCEID